ncbi:MAG: YceI family protein, partial [Rickettsiales bacterium]
SKKSSLTFTAEQAGEGFSGSFKRFTPHITFDKQALDKTDIRITIDMASVHVDGEDRNGEISKPEWLDSAKFATATFVATKTIATKNGYRAEGQLTLKGIIKPLALDFALSEGNGITTANGTATLNRRDFNVGVGSDWESDQWVAFPVDVQFTIVATPKP